MRGLQNASAIGATVVLGLAVVAGPARLGAQPQPDGLRGFVSLSSDYIVNGLSQTYDEPSLRIALDFEHQSGFFAGGSLANVDYRAEERFRTPRDSLVNVYAGYLWKRSQWMTNLTVSRYRYPGIARSYDYTQATANVAYRDRYFFSASRSSDFLSIYDSAQVYRAGMALPVLRGFELGINAGTFRSNGFVDTSFTFWDVGLSRPAGRFSFDLRFHDSSYEYSSLIGNYAGDLWVLSITYAFLPTGGRDR